jgi:hypothetical protein
MHNLEYQYQKQEITLTDKAMTALIPTYTTRILMKKELYKLCYIGNNFAYFTTQDLDKQWGDDWGDAPYEHNAEPPYTPHIRYYADGRTEKVETDWNEDGTPKWEIMKIAFCSAAETPAQMAFVGNSQYSVKQINAGLIPWLTSREHNTCTYAGASIDEFVQFIEDCEGIVYLPKQHNSKVVQYINNLATQIRGEDGAICIEGVAYQDDEFPPGFWRKLAKEVNYIHSTGCII